MSIPCPGYRKFESNYAAHGRGATELAAFLDVLVKTLGAFEKDATCEGNCERIFGDPTFSNVSGPRFRKRGDIWHCMLSFRIEVEVACRKPDGAAIDWDDDEPVAIKQLVEDDGEQRQTKA